MPWHMFPEEPEQLSCAHTCAATACAPLRKIPKFISQCKICPLSHPRLLSLACPSQPLPLPSPHFFTGSRCLRWELDFFTGTLCQTLYHPTAWRAAGFGAAILPLTRGAVQDVSGRISRLQQLIEPFSRSAQQANSPAHQGAPGEADLMRGMRTHAWAGPAWLPSVTDQGQVWQTFNHTSIFCVLFPLPWPS